MIHFCTDFPQNCRCSEIILWVRLKFWRFAGYLRLRLVLKRNLSGDHFLLPSWRLEQSYPYTELLYRCTNTTYTQQKPHAKTQLFSAAYNHGQKCRDHYSLSRHIVILLVTHPSPFSMVAFYTHFVTCSFFANLKMLENNDNEWTNIGIGEEVENS